MKLCWAYVVIQRGVSVMYAFGKKMMNLLCRASINDLPCLPWYMRTNKIKWTESTNVARALTLITVNAH